MQVGYPTTPLGEVVSTQLEDGRQFVARFIQNRKSVLRQPGINHPTHRNPEQLSSHLPIVEVLADSEQMWLKLASI